jgi:diguanylate cyclase (GGDEF)-like protein
MLSLILAGVVARAILFREFSNVIMEDSFRRFQLEMTAYLQKYGSWENAHHREEFGKFEKRRRGRYGPPLERTALRGDVKNLSKSTSPSTATAKSDVQSSIKTERERPPFRFMLTDPNGHILLGGKDEERGSMAPEWLRAQGKPIVVKGKVLLYALPDPQPNLNNLDLGYLKAIKQALLYGGIAAGVLALALGLLVGQQLGRRLSILTGAIRSMEKGELRQRVEIDARDEVGELATAFNTMSAELASAHEELQKSNEQIKAQAEQLRELSIRDGLTKLYNRRYFDEQCARQFTESIRYQQPLSVMIGDIDFFKKINDNFSHAIGDEVLRRVGKILQSMTRESDLVARYGGEEFVVAFPQTTIEAAAEHCEKLRSLIEIHPWHEVDPNLRVTMSMGLCDDAGLGSFEKMLAAADANLYHAKENGRNRIVSELPKITEAVAI